MILVILNAEEMLEARRVGIERYEYNRAIGTQQAHGFTGEVEYDILGATGEYAFCKWSGQPWSGFQKRYKGIADAGSLYEVRSTPHPRGNLLMHDTDVKSRIFILARLPNPPQVELVGWIFGRDGILPGWKWDGRSAPCYMFPAWRLNSMDEMPLDRVNNLVCPSPFPA